MPDDEIPLHDRLPATEAGGRASFQDSRPAGATGEPTRWRDGAPEQIGPYTITGLLGEGGMGRVFRAHQAEPVERDAAIKLVPGGFVDQDAALRFRAERQALARLSHANIARMYEASTTEGGLPYFVMELVDGPDLISYCDRHRLSLDQRLTLFLDVCAAVEHAHRHGILHRDLKPSNILVAEQEGRAIPKVIDFGIAKALDRPLTEETLNTGRGLVGTPGYMSPEALEMGEDLDTRTDVYSLGVLLYELCSGVRPFPDERNIARLIDRGRTAEAPRASTRYRGLDSEARAALARRRGSTQQELGRTLRGDLGWIADRALARDRNLRYGAASELADDLRRYLANEPIVARPPSLGYLFGRFVRRHRLVVAAGLVVTLTLVASVVGISVGLYRATTAEAEARHQAATAQEVTDFLVQLFEVSDPEAGRRGDVTARELLDRGAARIADELHDQPVTRATMMATLGRVHGRLGLAESAEPLLSEALELRRAATGDDDPAITPILLDLGAVYRETGRYAEAASAYLEAIDRLERRFGDDSPELVLPLRGLAGVYTDEGKFDRSDRELARALAITDRGSDEMARAHVLDALATNQGYRGVFSDSQPLFLEAYEIRRRHLGPDHVETGHSISRLALVAAREGDLGRAHELNHRALEIYEGALGPDHLQVQRVLSNIGYHLFVDDKPLEAVGYLERAVEIDERLARPETPMMASRSTNLGLVYWRLGRLDEAVPYFQLAIAIRERLLAPDHPHRGTSLWGLANVYRDQGQHREAESLYLEALRLRRAALPGDHFELLASYDEYAEMLRREGRTADLDALLAEREAGLVRAREADRGPAS